MFEPGHTTNRKPPFRFAAYTRVAFSDTDAQGIVYYGRYNPYFDLARTEYLRSIGPIELGRAEFVMRASTVEYHTPARFDDLLEIFVRVARIGTTSVTLEFAAYRLDDGAGDTLLVAATQTSVLIDLDDRSRTVRIPDGYRAAASAAEEAGL